MAVTLVTAAVAAGSGRADTFIFGHLQLGAYPAYEGSGWRGSVYLNIPDDDAVNLITAESYVLGRTPDFTFRTRWIDFPAGPTAVAPDTQFTTMGDFFNDYIYEVSDRSKLNAPFGSFLVRFEGLLRVIPDDGTQPNYGLPVWVDFGTAAYDGNRTMIGTEVIYRLPRVSPFNNFFTENGIFFALGLFPIEITYYNRNDPTNVLGYGQAGMELYSWHGGGLPWPAGLNMVHAVRGPATLVPPRVIYQPEDIIPSVIGDFDADGDVDLDDLSWFAGCLSGPDALRSILNCATFDSDGDEHVDLSDFAQIQTTFGS